MTRQALFEGLAALAILFAAGTPPAQAATYVNVDCYCDPKTESQPISGLVDDYGNPASGCVCTQFNTLAKFGTMEFRFRCKNDNAIAQPGTQAIADRDKPTTCTFALVTPNGGYITQSCTNWSTVSTDTLRVQTLCIAKLGQPEIWRMAADGGPAEQLTRDRGHQSLESPDGKRLYYSRGTNVLGMWVLDLETGEAKPVPQLAEAGFHRYWAGSRDGLYFLVGDKPAAATHVIKRFDFQTGNVSLAAQFQGRLVSVGGLAVAPDESALLFTTLDVDDKDIMMVDGFE